MFCQNCGNKLDGSGRFCAVCGNALESPQQKKNPHLPLLLGLLLLVGGLSAGQKENRHRLICQTGRLSRGDPFSTAVILILGE